jgi:hypothetical protein
VLFVVGYVPFPLTPTVCVKAGGPTWDEQVGLLGLKRLKVMLPVGLKPPDSVAESLGNRFGAVDAVGVFLLTTSCSGVQALLTGPVLVASGKKEAARD